MINKIKKFPYKQKISNAIDVMGLFFIALFSLAYCFFDRSFAELHIDFYFFNFPVFIGEILLFFCLILLFIKWKIDNQKFNLWYYLLFFYFGSILIKSFWGYLKCGPLAFRHAALFYYPLFALFGYSFYRREIFTNKKIFLLSILFLFIIKFIYIDSYFLLSCFILAVIFIKANLNKFVKYLFFFTLLVLTPYDLFFYTARTFIVGNLVTLIYIIVTVTLILKINKRNYKILIGTLSLIVLLLGLLTNADRNNVRSCTNIKEFFNEYSKKKQIILAKKDNFVMRELKEIKLYNPEERPFAIFQRWAKSQQISESGEVPQQISESGEVPSTSEQISQKISETTKGLSIINSQQKMKDKLSTQFQNTTKIDKRNLRDLGQAYNNSIFRIIVWEDMLSYLKNKRPIFGFDFGNPLRSPSLEILNWGAVDWSRDGWVAVHNSYLNIIYRSGIVGLLLILSIFFIIFKITKHSIYLGSLNGILLCGILINWLVAANFLEILELPYTAIPFWSIFGITLAYLENIRKNKLYENINNS